MSYNNTILQELLAAYLHHITTQRSQAFRRLFRVIIYNQKKKGRISNEKNDIVKHVLTTVKQIVDDHDVN
jgi:hypothetical protein